MKVFFQGLDLEVLELLSAKNETLDFTVAVLLPSLDSCELREQVEYTLLDRKSVV